MEYIAEVKENTYEIVDDTNNPAVYSDESVSVATQTDLSVDKLFQLFNYLKISSSKIDLLEKQLSNTELSSESFIGNDKKTKYFTGLSNSKILLLVHDIISLYLFSNKNSLPTF